MDTSAKQNIEQEGNNLIYTASKFVLDDLLWAFFGYKRRPLTGILFAIFKSRSELNRIKFLSREFFIFIFVIELKKYSPNIKQLIIQYIYKNYLFNPKYNIPETFKFKTNRDFDLYFQQGISDYDCSNYGHVMMNRFREILGNDFKPTWIVGISRMLVYFEGW